MRQSGGVLVWFRQDLRLTDNPALTWAIRSGLPVLPVYIWSPEEEGAWAPGGASRWWLHHSLAHLGGRLRRLGSRLVIRTGGSSQELVRLARATGATAVVWNRRYEPEAIRRDTTVKESLRAEGLSTRSFNGSLLVEPWEICTKEGSPYQVFTPFWRAAAAGGPKEVLPPPTHLEPLTHWPDSCGLDQLALLPVPDWAGGMRSAWTPGEESALGRLSAFVSKNLEGYADQRDQPGLPGTSMLSPALHFGEVSPRQVWRAVAEQAIQNQAAAREEEQFLRELGWREFAYHLLYHFPHTVREPLRPAFHRFPWVADRDGLRLWQQGRTGYPLVDAGMRQLWQTGWMHNRVRMVVASFLVKHLLTPWQQGAKWFWDTLVDADLAVNTLGWQWTAGCGADAAPYFRIFNPVAQGERYDSDGSYVRQWIPELAALPSRYIHRPWQAPAGVLAEAGVSLGATYPLPLVEHDLARTRALHAYSSLSARER